MSHHQENIIEKLDSCSREVFEAFKRDTRDQFQKVNEAWLINGLYTYYLNTSSVRCMEVIITLREPHQQYLFDRLLDSLKNPKSETTEKIQALTLLGHIVQNHPTWVQRLPEHNLFKEILRFLTIETELLPLVSALLVLIVLLPMFPSSIDKCYLNDIFDIFRRLAAWNSTVPGKLVEDQMIHLQVALYALFLRLYGMYPCNFLKYLKNHFKDRNNPVFCHTIKPMMDTVKMHPSLITTSEENETTTERWKEMKVQDVIVECERFSLDITDRCPHDTCQNTTEFRSRSGTMNSNVGSAGGTEPSYHQQNVRSLASLQMSANEGSLFSPSHIYEVHAPPITETTGVIQRHMPLRGRASYPLSQEGSPPEAAIEATPETTPIRDFTATPIVPLSTKTGHVVRALTSFRSNSSGGYIVSGTPTNSVPSSPMRKEPSSPFAFPVGGGGAGAGGAAEARATDIISRLKKERQLAETLESQLGSLKPPPSSPLKILNPDTSVRQKKESLSVGQEKEDGALIADKRLNAGNKKRLTKARENVLPVDCEDSDQKDTDDIKHGSPCAVGGLHMPNSQSINSFKKRIRRFRYSSQCNPELDTTEVSTGSSPGNGVPFASNTNVRRANSCPDMEEKSPQVFLKDARGKPFDETDEETVSEDQVSNTSNGFDVHGKKKRKEDSSTQTEVFWPMPYEHLFLTIFPSLKEDMGEVKPSPAPSPAPILSQFVEQYKPSLYDILDKYIEKCVATSDTNSLREQLQLVHQQLLFEQYRRETHAYRNRRLLSDAKSIRLQEECNLALKDQVQLGQREIDRLKDELDKLKQDTLRNQRQKDNIIDSLTEKCKKLTDENTKLNEANKKLELEVSNYKAKCNALDKERQQAESAFLEALAEGKVAKEQAHAGERYKQELQQINTELLLLGELHVKSLEKFDQISSMRQCDEEMKRLTDAYGEEIKNLQQVIDTKTTTIEAFKARSMELEQLLSAKEDTIAGQKRRLALANDRREALIEAIESKYQTQLVINRSLEERLFELHQKLEMETARRRTHSPDTSSCHEAQASSMATATGGLSPQHSSPLSASLASSEGSAAIHELRALQMCVDPDVVGSKAHADESAHGAGKND